MATRRDSAGTDNTTRGGVADAVRELLDLVVAYAKQETIGPLHGLVRFVLFGVLGALGLAGGGVLLALALLRLLQDETGGAFHGTRSWLPYLVVTAAALAVTGVAAWRVVRVPGRGDAEHERPEGRSGR